MNLEETLSAADSFIKRVFGSFLLGTTGAVIPLILWIEWRNFGLVGLGLLFAVLAGFAPGGKMGRFLCGVAFGMTIAWIAIVIRTGLLALVLAPLMLPFLLILGLPLAAMGFATGRGLSRVVEV